MDEKQDLGAFAVLPGDVGELILYLAGMDEGIRQLTAYELISKTFSARFMGRNFWKNYVFKQFPGLQIKHPVVKDTAKEWKALLFKVLDAYVKTCTDESSQLLLKAIAKESDSRDSVTFSKMGLTVETFISPIEAFHSKEFVLPPITPVAFARALGHTGMLAGFYAYCIKQENENEHAFWWACAMNQVDVLKNTPDWSHDVFESKHYGSTPLIVAAQLGNTECVNFLIQKDVNLNNTDETSGRTALHYAAESGWDSIVKLLLDASADASLREHEEGMSAFLKACEFGYLACVSYFISAGADVNQTDGLGQSGLMLACQWEHMDVVDYLLLHQANVNQIDSQGFSPLMLACQTNQLGIANRLLLSGANVNLRSKQGETALTLALSTRNDLLVQSLEKYGCAIVHEQDLGKEGLWKLAMTGNTYGTDFYLKKMKVERADLLEIEKKNPFMSEYVRLASNFMQQQLTFSEYVYQFLTADLSLFMENEKDEQQLVAEQLVSEMFITYPPLKKPFKTEEDVQCFMTLLNAHAKTKSINLLDKANYTFLAMMYLIEQKMPSCQFFPEDMTKHGAPKI